MDSTCENAVPPPEQSPTHLDPDGKSAITVTSESQRELELDAQVHSKYDKLKIYLAHNRNKIALTLLYTVIYMCVGMSFGALGPTVKSLQAYTNSSESQIGWLFAAHGCGTLISSFLSGFLYDAIQHNHFFSGHFLLSGATITLGLTLASTPFVPWIQLLGVSNVFKGKAQQRSSNQDFTKGDIFLSWIVLRMHGKSFSLKLRVACSKLMNFLCRTLV
jgi:hypothetical protein